MKNRPFHRKRNRGSTAQNRGFTVTHFPLLRHIGRIFGAWGALALCLAVCSACAIRVNWFGQSAMVPWYVVVVPVVAILLGAHLYFLSCRFICPKCATVIKPKWYEVSVWLHWGDRRVVKCPHCGRRGYCEQKRS